MSTSTVTKKSRTTVPDRRVTKLKRLVGKPKKKVSIEDMNRAIEGTSVATHLADL